MRFVLEKNIHGSSDLQKTFFKKTYRVKGRI